MISNIISLSYRLCVIYFFLPLLKADQNPEKQSIIDPIKLTLLP